MAGEFCKKWALYYRRKLNWGVIPLNGKTPRLAWSEFQDKLPTEEEIDSWWTRFPLADIGLIVGKPSGVIVLDVDDKEYLNGSAYELPLTPKAISGGGGEHYFFKYPIFHTQRAKNRSIISNESEKEAFSIRCQNQYVVICPSIHPETYKRYKWVKGQTPDDIELANPPNWILEQVFESESNDGYKNSGFTSEEWELKKKQITKILSKYWKVGQRQKLSMSLVGYLLKCGIAAENVEQLLKDITSYFGDTEANQRLAALRASHQKLLSDEKGLLGYYGLQNILSEEDLEELTKMFSSPPRVRINLLTVSDIFSTESDPDRFVINPIAMRKGLTLIAGPPGVGKTWLMLYLAMCVIQGEKVFGIWTTSKGKVIYIDQENPKSVLRDRLEDMDFPEDDNFKISHFKNIDIERDYNELIEMARNADLLIFDSLTQHHHRNEDKASEIKLIMNNLRNIANVGNCSIILLHQMRKPSQLVGNDLYRARGSGQIVYDVDMAFILDKTDDRRILRCVKSRVVQEPSPISFEIKMNDDFKVSLKYLGEYDESELKKTRARKLVPDVLKSSSSPLDWEEIQAKLRDHGLEISEQTLRPVLRDLVKLGDIKERSASHNKKYYFYPTDENEKEERPG